MPVSYMSQSILHNSLISQLAVIFQGYEYLEMIKISPLMTTVIFACLSVCTIVLNQFVFVFVFFMWLFWWPKWPYFSYSDLLQVYCVIIKNVTLLIPYWQSRASFISRSDTVQLAWMNYSACNISPVESLLTLRTRGAEGAATPLPQDRAWDSLVPLDHPQYSLHDFCDSFVIQYKLTRNMRLYFSCEPCGARSASLHLPLTEFHVKCSQD